MAARPESGIPRVEEDFRGVGWCWPLQLRADDGSVALAEHEQAIRQSILLILGTSPGERLMRPKFGCGIHGLVFSPNQATTAALISFEVREALLEWEPRIQVTDVKVESAPEDAEGSKLLIGVEYRVRSTNNVFNLVYPFYLQRGT